MKIVWVEAAWEDYLYWQRSDAKVLESINDLIKDVRRDPFRGLGKPEPLKPTLSGWWSRRITGDHRLVYTVSGKAADQHLMVAQCRYHYK